MFVCVFILNVHLKTASISRAYEHRPILYKSKSGLYFKTALGLIFYLKFWIVSKTASFKNNFCKFIAFSIFTQNHF